MRVLFIHEVNYSNKVIFEMHEFPELLALKGHDVTFFHFPESPETPSRSLRTRRESIGGRVYPDARIDLVTPPTLGGSVLERYVAPIWNLPSLRAEVSSGRYDVIVLYAVPTSGWQTVALARHYGVPVIFRALDVSHQIRRSPLSPLIRAAEKYIYRNAALLSGNNPAMVDYCVRISGRTGRTRVNLPPVDLRHFEESQAHIRREDLGLGPDDRVVLYMGSFFTFSGLDIALEGFAEQFRLHPRLKLVLVGGGDLDESLRRDVTRLGLEDRVVFTGVVPYADLPGYLHIADVAINPFVPQLLTHVALPHKILQYMAAGVPTVSTSLDGIRSILGDDSGVSWVDGPADIAQAATAVAFLEPEARAKIAAQQRAFVDATFAKDASVASLEDALHAVG
ncbi:glycosyltransferase family 4 protein [Agromyces badenianii]|uniref:glycosyltransferase family 4 protein n=1 Tax=Agromyces badenianii TaxID=2080742 RepID=UPI000D58F290|nr:glycosyltransferase family 4 protein [Agromyces badenianii]PWC03808.1 glycosyltransferase [Agromyces badenianii]